MIGKLNWLGICSPRGHVTPGKWGEEPDGGIWCGLTPGSEKAMAPHSSTLAWKIPWLKEPGRLQSVGLLRVRHD